MKKYKAIFFDWDGTAVLSRKAPVDSIIGPMADLLAKIPLVIISGTTYENIAAGTLHRHFDCMRRVPKTNTLPKQHTPSACGGVVDSKLLQNLYLGLGRGAYNYGFDAEGSPVVLEDVIPGPEELLKIHEICFEMHRYLLSRYGLATDIVFSRPNYCKIDLMTAHDRGDALFLQKSEITRINALLNEAGISGGLRQLIAECTGISKKAGLELQITSDAKYLEAGLSTKSDNTDFFLHKLSRERGIAPADCAFFGDEFCFLDEGIYGSDALMITELSRAGDFFDVSPEKGALPENVAWLGGGVNTFRDFLVAQNGIA